jgi:predicted NBD/HSP70 family sugar kinase
MSGMALLEAVNDGMCSLRQWQRAYETSLEPGIAREIRICIERSEGRVCERRIRVGKDFEEGYYLFERTIKFLLWQVGGNRVFTDADPTYVDQIAKAYATGERAFDNRVIGEAVFGGPIEFGRLENETRSETGMAMVRIGGYSEGCRVGFDLGGSDRKCAALRDGEVLYSEEIPWDPYHQTDPDYHWRGILDCIERAASHLPRIDAIGGSAAGIYVNNEPRIGSLFRGVSTVDFKRRIRPIFKCLSERYGVPVQVVNDGDATALSAAQSRGLQGVLGIAMGTSMAVGYVDELGSLRPWLNELAFAPIDTNPLAPIDEWSGDRGCGASYFSQQAVGRLMVELGLSEGAESLPERLKIAQAAVAQQERWAVQIFERIGDWLGQAILQYLDFYSFEHVLLLGRVTSGLGSELILSRAKHILAESGLNGKVPKFLEPTEIEKRHGQAIAAAGLVPDELLRKTK